MDPPITCNMALILGETQISTNSHLHTHFISLLLRLLRRRLPGRRFPTRFPLVSLDDSNQLRPLDRYRPHTTPAVNPEQCRSKLLGRHTIEHVVEREPLGGDDLEAPDGADELGDGAGGIGRDAANPGARGGGREP